MNSKEKLYLDKKLDNILSVAIKMINDEQCIKNIKPFHCKSNMDKQMIEIIATYDTDRTKLLFDVHNNVKMELFFIRIYENEIMYATAIDRTENVAMIEQYSEKYGDKLEWKTCSTDSICTSEQLADLIMKIFNENSDYVEMDTKGKCVSIMLEIFSVICVLAILFIGICELVNAVRERDITSLLSFVCIGIIVMIIYFHKKRKVIGK